MVDYATACVYLVSALTRSERADSGRIANIQEPGRCEDQYTIICVRFDRYETHSLTGV